MAGRGGFCVCAGSQARYRNGARRKCAVVQLQPASSPSASRLRKQQIDAISKQPRAALAALARGALPGAKPHVKTADATHGKVLSSASRAVGPKDGRILRLAQHVEAMLAMLPTSFSGPLDTVSLTAQGAGPCQPDSPPSQLPGSPSSAVGRDSAPPAQLPAPQHARNGRSAGPVGERSDIGMRSSEDIDAALVWADLDSQAPMANVCRAFQVPTLMTLQRQDCQQRLESSKSTVVIMNPLHDAYAGSRDMESLACWREGHETVHLPTDHLRADDGEADTSSQGGSYDGIARGSERRRLGPLWRCMLCGDGCSHTDTSSEGTRRRSEQAAASAEARAEGGAVCESAGDCVAGGAAPPEGSPRAVSIITFTPAKASFSQADPIGQPVAGAADRSQLYSASRSPTHCGASTVAAQLVSPARIGTPSLHVPVRVRPCSARCANRSAANLALQSASASRSDAGRCSEAVLSADAASAHERRCARKRRNSAASAGRLHAHTAASAARVRATSARAKLVASLRPGVAQDSWRMSPRARAFDTEGVVCIGEHSKPANAALGRQQGRSSQQQAATSSCTPHAEQGALGSAESPHTAANHASGGRPAPVGDSVEQGHVSQTPQAPTVPHCDVLGASPQAVDDGDNGTHPEEAQPHSISMRARIAERERLEEQLSMLEASLGMP